MLLKVAVLKNSENNTVKHLCWSLFFNRIADLSMKFYYNETAALVFSCEKKLRKNSTAALLTLVNK